VAPLTNGWLYGYGLGDGSTSGGEGIGALETGFGVEGGLEGLGELGIDWSISHLKTSHETPTLGGEVSPASFDGESSMPLTLVACLCHSVGLSLPVGLYMY
jgi:hypothetical protein